MSCRCGKRPVRGVRAARRTMPEGPGELRGRPRPSHPRYPAGAASRPDPADGGPPPRVMPWTRAIRPPVPVMAPGTSRQPGCRSASTRDFVPARTARPMGMSMKNTQRQSNASVSTPPGSSSTVAPTPAMAAYTPMAVSRDLPAGKVVVIRASELGAARAAPTPWRKRASALLHTIEERPPVSVARRRRFPALAARRIRAHLASLDGTLPPLKANSREGRRLRCVCPAHRADCRAGHHPSAHRPPRGSPHRASTARRRSR